VARLVVFGTGHGAIELLEQRAYYFAKSVCVEDMPQKDFLECAGIKYPVISMADYKCNEHDLLINSVMDIAYKKRIAKQFKKAKWLTFVSDNAICLGTAGKGSIVQPFCFVGSTSVLGDFVKLNHYARVQCAEIGDYSFMGSGSQILGNVKVGSCTLIYSGATVIPGVTIGSNTIIGAGSLVTKDIPDGVVAYGNPCRVIRENTDYVHLYDGAAVMEND
jgi:serine acetyltransferase